MADSANRSRAVGILIALMVVLVVALAAMNLIFLLGDDGPARSAPAASKAATPEPTRLVTLEPFTVNVRGDLCGQRLLYVGLALQVGDEISEKYLNDNRPQLRSRLLMLLSSQDSRTAASAEGKRALAESVKAMFEQPLTPTQPKLAVDDVLFTEFIVQ